MTGALPPDPFGGPGEDPVAESDRLRLALIEAALDGLGPLSRAIRALDEPQLRGFAIGQALGYARAVQEAHERRRVPRRRRLRRAVSAAARAFRGEMSR